LIADHGAQFRPQFWATIDCNEGDTIARSTLNYFALRFEHALWTEATSLASSLSDIRLFAAQFDKTLLVQTGLMQNLQEISILLLNADTNMVSTTMVSNQAFAII